jgi:hypothetical protein
MQRHVDDGAVLAALGRRAGAGVERHLVAKHGADRVALVDWDVHHGNGSQDIFWDDPAVLYAWPRG